MTTTARAPYRSAAIRLEAVRKSFGSVTAVAGIDLRIEPGEIVALLGPNGAGKTSTIDMLLGLSEPTEGVVSVFGMTPPEAMSYGLVSAVMQSGDCSRTTRSARPWS